MVGSGSAPTRNITVSGSDKGFAVCNCTWLLWSINAVVAAIVLFFFFWGLMDGSVSSRWN